jgi:hypothetical protein
MIVSSLPMGMSNSTLDNAMDRRVGQASKFEQKWGVNEKPVFALHLDG